MKRIAWVAALVMVFSSPVWAQAAKPAAKEAPKEAAAKAAEAKPAAVAARKSRRNGDARHCLEQATNTAIIKCAERYL
ncbi:MAG: hypothetical protein AABM33_14350 [Pseudomonadota bacterium]